MTRQTRFENRASQRRWAGVVLGALVILAVTGQEARATGAGASENPVFSAKNTALGFAGTAAPSEPAAISYNPAGIADLCGFQVQQSIMGMSGWTFHRQEDVGSNRYGGTVNVLPTEYITFKPAALWAEAISFGIGVDSPFGLARQMDSTYPIFRYTGYQGDMKMFAVKPTVAIKINDQLSVGGGPVYNRILDYGAALHYPNQLLQRLGMMAGPPYLDDGEAHVNLAGDAWSWQAGALYKPNDRHSFGFYFRSPFVARLRGALKVQNSAFYPGGSYETPVDAKLGFPFNMTLGYAFSPTDTTTIMLDLGYTRWSTINRIVVNGDPTGSAVDDIIISAIGTNNIDYQNAYNLNLGINEQISRKLALRGGAFFIWSPTPETGFTPMIPDTHRFGVTCGFGYELKKNIMLDFAYALSVSPWHKIDNDIGESLGTSVDGEYLSHMHLLALSLTIKK